MNKIIDLKILTSYENKSLKIGILGGSFDPPHKGHFHIAEKALENLDLDEVWLALSPQNPLKPPPHFSFEQRLEMLQKLLEGNNKLKILTVENELKINLTADLFSYLNNNIGTNKFQFIIGADIAPSIHQWEKIDELLNETNIVIFSRARYTNLVEGSEIIKNNKYQDKVRFIPIDEVDISSTELRQKANDKKY